MPYGDGDYGAGNYGALTPFTPILPPPLDPMPPLGSLGNRLYEMLQPLAYADAENDWALLKLCDALMGNAQELEDLVRDTDEGSGWSALVDPDRAPEKALAFVGQLVGVRLRPGLTEAAQRERIKATDGFHRGTTAAMIAAAQQYLTGNKTVFLNERHGSAYRLTVSTWTSETPDAALVLDAIQEQKPGGIILTHAVIPGGDFDTLNNTHTDFDDVTGTFSDFDDVRSDPSQQ